MKKPKIYVVRAKTNGECNVKDCHDPKLKETRAYAPYCDLHMDRVAGTKRG